ncbi:IS3 family transposase [Streptomyces sp. NPDC059680]|uniref:IS3 family transposase n=1 Tax=Streptomyces sp. NPDC059680 TaxID=3346904 RepID=UPI00367959CF
MAREKRQAAEDALGVEIREVHTAHKGTYGVRRIHAELRGFGHTVNRKRVERLMRRHGIEGGHLRRRKRTTVPNRLAPPAPDLVQGDFFAARLDEKWCGDITYVQVGSSWLYLACVIDICSRRVLGYSMASPHADRTCHRRADDGGRGTRRQRRRSDLPREPGPYTSAAFAQVCDGFGIRRSMGRVGSRYDNALAESFWQGLKKETMPQRLFTTMRQTRLEIFQWLTYYNTRRRHSALNYLSPAEFEQPHQRGRKLTLAA